jgi:hypothetical protein
MAHESTITPYYGLMAEFLTPEAVLDAARRSHAEGYRYMEAYSPMPVDGLAEALGFERNRIALVVLIGGLLGAATAYGTMWFSSTIHYPLNVGGRPLHSWPAFIPITFELTILFASFAAALGMLALNGLPQPYHPAFNVPSFALASRNRFFLFIRWDDPLFDPKATRAWLEGLGPKEVNEVPR